jgi:ankyrin repeat protein
MPEPNSHLVDAFINACITSAADAKALAQAHPTVLDEMCSFGEPAVHWLTIEDFQEGLRIAVGLGASVATRDSVGATALAVAAHIGRLGCARLLLDLGADPNSDDGAMTNPLHAAIAGGALDVVGLLLERGADPWFVSVGLDTVFSAMAGLGDHDRTHMVERLAERGVTRSAVFAKAGFDRIYASEADAFGW